MGCVEHGRTPLSAYEEGLCATEIFNCELPLLIFIHFDRCNSFFRVRFDDSEFVLCAGIQQLTALPCISPLYEQ